MRVCDKDMDGREREGRKQGRQSFVVQSFGAGDKGDRGFWGVLGVKGCDWRGCGVFVLLLVV